jgi:hypothetical protein
MELGTFTTVRPKHEHRLAPVIRTVVREAEHGSQRSMQRALGPSEIGDPCARKLAYRLLDHPRTNTDSDPWAAIVGTAVHAWLADAFLAQNARLGRPRWLVETRLEIRPGLIGSCDLFDADELTVIDHKVLGATTMRKYSSEGPPDVYVAQAHLYGLGWHRLGVPVRDVALAMYPRSGLLSGLRIWSQPWDPAAAQAALDRHDAILAAADALDCEHNPAAFKDLPREPGHSCTYCQWLQPGPDTGNGCPGHLAA